MGALHKRKREIFCQLLANGVDGMKAFVDAGFSSNPQTVRNWSKLAKLPAIRDRVNELKLQNAKRDKVTPELIREMLEEDREGAQKDGQWGAAVAATEKIARLYGLFIERSEQRIENKGNFDPSSLSDDQLRAIQNALNPPPVEAKTPDSGPQEPELPPAAPKPGMDDMPPAGERLN